MRRVCDECDRDLTRGFHEVTCSVPAREHERARQAMAPRERWLDDLTPGRGPVLLHGQRVHVRTLSIADLRSSAPPTVTLIVELAEEGER